MLSYLLQFATPLFWKHVIVSQQNGYVSSMDHVDFFFDLQSKFS